jgi:hypothetical protein
MMSASCLNGYSTIDHELRAMIVLVTATANQRWASRSALHRPGIF